MGDKGGAVALVVEAPYGACFRRFEIRQSPDRVAVDEIGDGIESLDRKSAETVDHDPLGGGGVGGKTSPNHANAGQKRKKTDQSTPSVTFLVLCRLPLCRHSWYR